MKLISFLLVLLLNVSPVLAEYYRYTDENGVLHFTDNLADVPVSQRTDTNRFKEIQSVTSTAPVAEKAPALSENNITGQEETRTLSALQKLNNEKQVLDNWYEELVTKKQALKKEKPSLSSADELAAYQKRVAALNQQISEFEARRQAFAKKVETVYSRQTPD